MRKTYMRFVMAALSSLLVGGLAACGSSSTSSGGTTSSNSGSVQTPSSQSLTGGKKGGVLTAYTHEDFQHIDPGQAYFSLDYEALSATDRQLYSYLPNDPNKPVPDLASGPPTISPDGLLVTVHIKHGVHFSPPINREVTSSDVAYAIERGANPNVANGYFPAYFMNIKGADKATGGPIPGITTPDKYTIVFQLAKPTSSILVGALALPLSAPVPPEMARKLDAQKPTGYGNIQVASGPYMFKADAHGKVLGIGYNPGRSAILVRNPNWNPATDFRPAYLNQININIGGDTTVIGRQVLTGSAALENDTLAQSIVKLAFQKYPKQLDVSPGASVGYLSLNNHHGPFTNVNLRRAVWAATPRVSLIKLGGGPLVGDPATHFIYPTTVGFDQAGGLAGPPVDYNRKLDGDMALAARYIKAAGFPSGKYTGGQTVTVISATGAPAPQQGQLVSQTLQNLGFKTVFKAVDQSAVYSKYCGLPKAEIDVCTSVGWLRDFSDPQTALDPNFNGKNIVPSNNSNYGQVNDPQINAAMDKAELAQGDTARAQAWANIDKMLVDKAVAVPWQFQKEPLVESADVVGVTDVWNQGGWDYSFTSLK
jgi:peptide/nickel transport system substrate-binding protein